MCCYRLPHFRSGPVHPPQLLTPVPTKNKRTRRRRKKQREKSCKTFRSSLRLLFLAHFASASVRIIRFSLESFSLLSSSDRRRRGKKTKKANFATETFLSDETKTKLSLRKAVRRNKNLNFPKGSRFIGKLNEIPLGSPPTAAFRRRFLFHLLSAQQVFQFPYFPLAG